MLKLRHLFDNRNLAMMLLNNWQYDSDALEIMDHFRISANAVYPFVADGGVRILRFAPAIEKRESDVRAELEFIQYLRDRGYPALRAVPAKDGRALVKADTPWGEYLAVAFDRVPGESLENAEITPDIAACYGAALGRLHTLSTKYHPTLTRWSHEDALAFEIDIAHGFLVHGSLP